MRMSEETLTKTAERLGRAREDVREMLSFLDEMFPPESGGKPTTPTVHHKQWRGVVPGRHEGERG